MLTAFRRGSADSALSPAPAAVSPPSNHNVTFALVVIELIIAFATGEGGSRKGRGTHGAQHSQGGGAQVLEA
jgi:hypothetical protein